MLFWLLSFFILNSMGLFHYLVLGPRGIHFIRQSDGLSFVMAYFQYGNGLFEPRVLEMTGIDGKAAAEFPLIYYLVAKVFNLTGPHYYYLRIANFAIAILGVYAWFRVMMKSLGRFSLAYCTAWLPFSSTVFFYYATGMVPDIPALGFSLIGFAFAFSGFEKAKNSHFYWALLFFTLAGLTKITSLILPLSLPFVILFFQAKRKELGGKPKKYWLFRTSIWALIPLIIGGIWAMFAVRYNHTNGNPNFLMATKPYWTLDEKSIAEVWDHVTNYWYTDYFHPDLWTMWMVLFPVTLLLLLKGRDVYRILFLPLFLGSVALFILFFRQYQHHDYYIIISYSTFAFMLWSFLLQLKLNWPKIFKSIWIPLPFIIFLVMSFKYSDKGLRYRNGYKDSFSAPYLRYENYYQTLDQMGIGDTASFAVLGDDTPNGMLIALRRRGYSVRDTSIAEASRMMVMHGWRNFDYAIALDGFDYPDTIKNSWSMIPLIQNDSIQLYQIIDEKP